MSDTTENTENTEKKELSPKEQLPIISERINNLNVTRNTCIKLMEGGVIKIVDGNPPKEGEEPLSLDISGEVVQTMLTPVLNIVNRRKEEFLAYKENLLAMIEQELTK